jgi:hypothetical protein
MAPDCGEGTWCAPPAGACVTTDEDGPCPPGYAPAPALATTWSPPDCDADCGACEFGCAAEVELFPGAACGAGGSLVPSSATCVTGGVTYYAATYDDTATCLTTDMIPSPAAPDTPVTVCCAAS